MTICVVIAAILAAPSDYAKLAHSVITQTAQVKPGEVIVINGGKHTTPLLEELAIEAFKAGGFPTIFLDSDKIERAVAFDVPAEYLAQTPTYLIDWFSRVDLVINLPTTEDPAATADMPADRQAKAGAAFQPVTEAMNKARYRIVNLSFPSKSEAAFNKVAFEAYAKMEREAMGADGKAMAAAAAKLKALLAGAKQVHLTSPAGTDVTFAPGGRPVSEESGLPKESAGGGNVLGGRVVNLPGGRVAMAPVETSANGKVVVPKDVCMKDSVKNASFELKDGMMVNYKAEKGGDCVPKILAAATGPKDRFGYFRIGLNPALRPMDSGESRYYPFMAAGMVWIGVGANTFWGGSNDAANGVLFPIAHATVDVDGQTIVKDGKLVQ